MQLEAQTLCSIYFVQHSLSIELVIIAIANV